MEKCTICKEKLEFLFSIKNIIEKKPKGKRNITSRRVREFLFCPLCRTVFDLKKVDVKKIIY